MVAEFSPSIIEMAFRRRFLLIVLGAAGLGSGFVAAACGSFGGTDAPTPTPDAAAPVDAPSATDAGAAPSGDASSDAALDPGQCPIVFTDHFDTLGAGWTTDLAAGGASGLNVDVSEFTSAPGSLHAFAKVGDGGPQHAAVVRTPQFGKAGLGVTQLSFAMKIEAPVGTPTYEEFGCQATLRNPTSEGTVAIFSRFKDGSLVAHVATDFDGGLPAMLTPTIVDAPGVVGWYDATLTIVPAAAGASFTFTLKDRQQTSLSYTVTAEGPPPTNVDRIRIGCGISYAKLDSNGDAGTSTVSAHVDDVTLRHCDP